MILIICPLKPEWSLAAKTLTDRDFEISKKQNQGNWYFEVPDLNARLCIGGMGSDKINPSIVDWCGFFKDIERVFVLGAAGSLAPNLNIGDVVIANKVIAFNLDPQKEFSINHGLQALSPFETFVHFGCLASGNETIESEQRAEKVRQKTNAMAVTWESHGAIEATSDLGLPYQEIRGITDDARNQVVENFKKNLPLAMKNATQVLIEILN